MDAVIAQDEPEWKATPVAKDIDVSDLEDWRREKKLKDAKKKHTVRADSLIDESAVRNPGL